MEPGGKEPADPKAARAFFDAAELLGRSEIAAGDQRRARALLYTSGIAAAEHADASAVPSANEVAALRARHAALLDGLEGIERYHRGLERRRATVLAAAMLLGAVLALIGFRAVQAATRPRNLLEGKPWTLSSEALRCHPELHECGGTRTDIFFHTANEPSPWIRFDLGAPTSLSSVMVRNRQDMGLGRCLPLVLEVSSDGKTWREVARINTVFSTWEPTFAKTQATMLRLRVDGRTTWLHLEWVEAHP